MTLSGDALKEYTTIEFESYNKLTPEQQAANAPVDEWFANPENEGAFKAIWDAADVDKDGRLSLAEFKDFYNRMCDLYTEKGGVMPPRDPAGEERQWTLLNGLSDGDGPTFAEFASTSDAMGALMGEMMGAQ